MIQASTLLGLLYQVAPLTPGAPGNVTTEAPIAWLDLLGRLHPALVHLPIGFVFALALIELFGFGELPKRYTMLRRATLLVAVLAAATTATSGWFLARPGEYDTEVLFWHRWLGVAVAVVLAFATIADLFSWRAVWRRFGVLLAVGLVGLAGHQGGSLTHGPNYLTRGAPDWMRRAIEALSPASYGGSGKDADEAPAERPPGASDPAPTVDGTDGIPALDHSDEPEVETGLPVDSGEGGETPPDPDSSSTSAVFGLLKENCFRCHGPRKRKAGLRLDQREGLLSVLTPGAAPDSEIFRRVSLPEDHEDVMPPSGPGVSETDLAALRNWINAGAPFRGLELSGDAVGSDG